MKYGENEIPVCSECAVRNEAEDMVKLCERCGVAYCAHFASVIDIKYCGNCMSDFKITESIETKTVVYENHEGMEINRRRQIAKSLKLSGTDWFFANKQISLCSNEELDVAIEYHRNIMGAMLLEREERKTERLNKLSKIKISLPKRTDVDATGAKKTPKAAKVAKDPLAKQQAQIAKALSGLSPLELQKVLEALTGQK